MYLLATLCVGPGLVSSWAVMAVMGHCTGLLPGPAWPGAAILSSVGKLGDLSGIDVEPELIWAECLQWVVCAAAAWTVLPCHSVFGLFLTTSLIIARNLPISPRSPAAPSENTIHMTRRVSVGTRRHKWVTWGMGGCWGGECCEDQVIRSAALSSLCSRQQKSPFSASWSHQALAGGDTRWWNVRQIIKFRQQIKWNVCTIDKIYS